MIQSIRDGIGGIIAKIIMAIVALTIALTGFDYIFNGVNTSSTRNKGPVIAKVNGQEILRTDLDLAVNREMQRMKSLANLTEDDIDELKNILEPSAKDALITNILLNQETNKLKLDISNDDIDYYIVNTESFQTNGKFDANVFDAVLSQAGITRLQYRSLLAASITADQLRFVLGNGGTFITQEEAKKRFELANQRRRFEAITFKAKDQQIDVSDDDIQKYYDENKRFLQTEETVSIEYVTLSKNNYADQVMVTDADLQEDYKAWSANQGEQRRFSHILKTTDNAEQEIKSLKRRIEAGEDFAAIAKEESEDTSSANNKGDLGFMLPDDTALTKAGYSIPTIGDLVVVKSDFGYHLIQWTESRHFAKDFTEIKSTLEDKRKREEINKLYQDDLRKLTNIAFEYNDLKSVADEMKLEIASTDKFTKSGLREGIASIRKIVNKAFSDEFLEDRRNSDLIEINKDEAIVFHVKEHDKPREMELEEVRANITNTVTLQKQAAKTRQLAIEFLRGDKQSNDWVPALVARGKASNVYIGNTVFGLSKPTENNPVYGHVALPNGDHVVVRVNEVLAPDKSINEDFMKELLSSVRDEDYRMFISNLKVNANIENIN